MWYQYSLLLFPLLLGWFYSPAVLAQSGNTSATEAESCYRSFTKLEENLLSRSSNRFNILSTFYPVRKSHPVFVHVNYTYTHADNGSLVPGMSELWYWTMSEFYLIQPLEVFQFTSLFFANRPSREGRLVVQLDRECAGADASLMEMLTQRMKLYAQVATTSVSSSTQRSTDAYTASAASRTDVERDVIQSDFIKAWLHIFLLLFPIGTALLLWLCDPVHLLLGDKTWQSLVDEQNHPTIAALIQVSVLFTVFVFATDWFGVAYTIKTEYWSYDRHAAFYLSTVTGLLVDMVAFGWVMIVLATSCHWDCKHMWVHWRSQECKPGGSERIKKLMSTLMLSPLLCFANHLHYIILAWMSDPFHAGSIAILYLVTFFLFYFIFHQFYGRLILRSHRPPSSRSATHETALSPVRNYNARQNSKDSTSPFPVRQVPVCRIPFNTKAIFVGLVVVTPLLALYEAAILLIFLGLPIIKTIEDSPSQIYSIYQGTGILIVALLTYSIVLHPSAFSIPRLVNKFAKQTHLADRILNWNRLGDEEKCAIVLKNVFHVTVDCDNESGDELDREEWDNDSTNRETLRNSRAVSTEDAPTLRPNDETAV